MDQQPPSLTSLLDGDSEKASASQPLNPNDPESSGWPKHPKHFFVLSSAGRPVYSLYGDEQKLASFMAATSGIVSFIGDLGDAVRHFQTASHRFVFLLRGPLYLVAISRTGESTEHLVLQLTYLYAQLVALLTSAFNRIFRNKPGFDLRNLLGGAGVFFDRLLQRLDCEAAFFLDAVPCVRLPVSVRQSIGAVLQGAHHPELLFAIVLGRRDLIHMVRPRRFVLQPMDLHLLANFVTASASFRQAESWTPVCLPKFNDRGYVHAYVSYLADDVCLVLVAAKQDQFFAMAQQRQRIAAQLRHSGALAAVERALAAPPYSVQDTGVPGLWHFLYKSRLSSQCTSPQLGPPYVTRPACQRLFRLYQHVFTRVHAVSNSDTGTTAVPPGDAAKGASPHQDAAASASSSASPAPHQIYYHCSDQESLIGWTTPEFELYAVFSPLETKQEAVHQSNQLLRWLKQTEEALFILNSPVYT